MTEINEANMKEFFQSVVDRVATLSTQAAKVEQLEQRVNDLYNRISQLESENTELRRVLNAAQSSLQETQSTLMQTQSSLDAERNTSQALRDTIVSRDSRVSELVKVVDDTNQALHNTTHERDVANNELNDVRAYNDSLKDQLNTARETADHWQRTAGDFERKVQELEQRLAKIRGVIGDPEPSNVVGFAQTA
jgi:chromosome segregation ATPase